MRSTTSRYLLLIAILATVFFAKAQQKIDWQVSETNNAGWGEFAPYYIASNSDGIFNHPISAVARVRGHNPLETSTRFDYGFGADLAAGYNKGIEYSRYSLDTRTWGEHSCHAPYAWVQQLWAGVKYRGVFATLGMKANDRSLFDCATSSGDIVVSRNARPIPQLQIGFIDFQDIPFTHGWVQIRGDIAYGKFMDSKWNETRFNYYTGFYTTDVWFHSKSCHFRTNPSQPFVVTVGMQHVAQFGGTKHKYENGKLAYVQENPVKFKDFVDVFVQARGGASGVGGDAAYYKGNHLGSWDLNMQYKFHDESVLEGYFQWPWEDGSGIGKLNGFDGVWGLRYTFHQGFPLRVVNIEYLDFMNHSGPMHWAPNDHPGTGITGAATGSDDYYNNFYYNGWQNYGMGIGSPFLKSPFYNQSGYLQFTDTRLRGFHFGAEGMVNSKISWRLLASYRKSYGTPYVPAVEKRHDISFLLEATYKFPSVKGLVLTGAFAMDRGSIYGNNTGLLLGIAYNGVFIY